MAKIFLIEMQSKPLSPSEPPAIALFMTWVKSTNVSDDIKCVFQLSPHSANPMQSIKRFIWNNAKYNNYVSTRPVESHSRIIQWSIQALQYGK